MKNLISIFSSLILVLFLSACGGEKSASTEVDNTDTDSSMEEEGSAASSLEGDLSSQAVCLWSTAGLRDKPGRSGAKYLTGVKFGETVSLTGKSEEIVSEKRTYIQMKLSDGKEGWANEYLFAKGAKPVVSIAGIDIFKRPDLTTLTDKRIEAGTLFALAPNQEKDGWAEVFTVEKAIAGWTQIKESMYTEEPTDIALGKIIAEVDAMKSTAEKVKRLETVSSSPSFSGSSLMPMVTEMLENLDKRTKLPNTQLMITGNNVNVRSAPDTDKENVVFQLNDGDICEILERSEKMVDIGGHSDYWYMVQKDGQSGWVFGQFTSKSK